MGGDPYPYLSNLCGIAAFRLPPRPVPDLRLSSDHHTSYPVFGPIPDHLVSRYLCYDDPFAEPPHSSSSNPHSPSPTLILPSPPPCPQESLVSYDPDTSQNQMVHEREILPPCVVNYQDSPSWTPERQGVVGESDYENWMPVLSIDVALCDQNHASTSVVKKSAFVSPYYTRSKSAKRLALS